MPDTELLDQLHAYGDALEACVASVTADDAMTAAVTLDGIRDRSARRSRRMWLVTAAAAVLVAVVVAGQLVAGGPIPFGASSDDITLRDTLVDRRFVVSSITEDGEPKVLVGPALNGEPAIGEITFGRSGNPANWTWSADDDVYVSSSGGCNSTSGGFEVVDGRLAIVGDQSMTMAGCVQEVMDQDRWMSSFLNDSPAITLDGERLTLTTATTTVELVERAAPPDPPAPPPPTPLDPSELTGRTFVATAALVGGEERRIVGPADEPEPHRLRMTFGDGTVSVTAGCSSGTGPFTIEMGRIEGLATTPEVGCPQDLIDQDTWLNDFFSTPPSLSVDGDYLTLGNQTDTIFVFVDEAAAIPLVAPSPFTDTRWNLTGESVPAFPGSYKGLWEAYLIVTGGDHPEVHLRDGCNVVTGSAQIQAESATTGTLTMGDLERTDAFCPAPLDQVAEVMTAIQTGTWSYAIDINRLELSDGTRTVVFQTT